jgi:hypothetical protein
MTFTNIVDGYPGDPAVVMENFKHVNYGNPLIPVNSSGVGVDNTISLGSSSNRFSAAYANGVASGSATAPLWKWGRVALSAKDIINGLVSGVNLMFTVDISTFGSSFQGLAFSLTLKGDNGLIIGEAEKIIARSVNSGVGDFFYPHFTFEPASQTSILVYQNLLFGGVYDGFLSYFHTNLTNWDGSSVSRGWLEVFYIS